MTKKLLFAVFIVTAFFLYSCFESPITSDDNTNNNTDTTNNNNNNNDTNTVDTVNMSTSQVDSTFDVLVEKINSMENIESLDDFYAMDFGNLSTTFEGLALAQPTNIKINTGLIVSAILSLNKSSDMKKLADSLDSYFNSLDGSSRSHQTMKKNLPVGDGYISSKLFKKKSESHMMRKALDEHGINGLGIALATRTPELVVTRSADPSIPSFLTVSFIQGIAMNDIIPVLDKVIKAFQRLEDLDSMTFTFTVEGEEVEVDLGDIYILDAGVRLLRAELLMFATYDIDVFTSATDQTYSWIEDMIEADDQAVEKNVYTLSNDTVYVTEIEDNSAMMLIMCDVVKYNLERSSYLAIKNQNHAKAYADYLAVPDLIKTGLDIIQNETDDQNNDVLPKSIIDDASGEMLDLYTDMVNEGFSTTLAANFKTPAALMDFIKSLLSGPYTFNETIDGITINLTIDLSKFFTDPVEDLKTLLPKHKLRTGNDRLESYKEFWEVEGNMEQYAVYMYKHDDDEVNVLGIDSSLIDSITSYTWSDKLHMNTEVNYRAYVDSGVVAIPADLTDASGNVLTPDTIDDLIESETFLPYFDDYTFNGIFPGMTRQKWLDLIYQ